MGRIINLSEATNVSVNDYILIDSPSLGTRKYLASNLQITATGGSQINQKVIDNIITSTTTMTCSGEITE